MTESDSATREPSSPSPPETARRARRRGWRWALIALATGIVLVAQLALSVPWALQSWLPRWVKQHTGRELVVGRASFNPFTLELKLGDVKLADGERVLARFDGLEVRGAWSSLAHLAWTTQRIALIRPQVFAQIDRSGSLDWQRFIAALPHGSDAPSDTLPRVVLNDVKVTEGAFHLRDERADAGADRLTLSPLSFAIERLSTLPRDRGEYTLDATLDDKTRVHWQGRVGLNPIESSGQLRIGRLPLSRLAKLLAHPLPFNIDGTANLQAGYSAVFGTDVAALGIGDGALDIDAPALSQGADVVQMRALHVAPLSASWAKTRVEGHDQHLLAVLPLSVKLTAIEARAAAQKGKSPLATIAEVATVQPITVVVAERRVVVPALRVAGAQMMLERAANGSVVLPFAASAAAAVPSPVAATEPTASGVTTSKDVPPPWRLSLGEVATDDARVGLLDASFASAQRADFKLGAALAVEVELADVPRVAVTGQRLAASDLSVRDATASTPWLAAREVRAVPFKLAWPAPTIELPKLDIIAPQIALSLDRDGLDVQRRLQPAVQEAGARESARTAHAGRAPTLAMSGIALSEGRIALTDATLQVPLTHTIDALSVTAGRATWPPAKPLDVTARATLAHGGEVGVKWRHDLARGRGEGDIDGEQLKLAPYSPYLARSTRLALAAGVAAVHGRVMLETANPMPSMRFAGNAAVRDVRIDDRASSKPFAQWAELSSQNLSFDWSRGGARAALADLLLDAPRGEIIIGEDGTLNLTQIGNEGAVSKQAPLPVDAPSSNLDVRIDRMQVSGGDIHYADLSLRPQFGTRVSDLSGLIVGIASDGAARAEVALEGKVDEYGLARLSGTVAPMAAAQYTDLKASFRNLDMASLTPYSGKFAGRRIDGGKLSLELEYKVVDRRLKGENQIVIDNLRLGGRVESKDATSLPLDLAVALLADGNGVIELGLPVQGSLDDPQFSFGQLVWKAITNVLGKIVSAPFRALGALLGGNGENFEAVQFEPGEARLLPPEREKIARLGQALVKRPRLKLTIEGRFDRERDREALADNIVKLDIGKRAGLKPPSANEPLIISFTDSRVQEALDELAAGAGEAATALRAQYLPAAGNALGSLLQGARERFTAKGRSDAAEARGKYYPALFRLLRDRQSVPELAFTTLATLRAEAIRNTLAAVNQFDINRVAVAAPQPVKTSERDRVASTFALAVP